MVVKRRWKVVSGSVAAGAILVPSAAMAQNGLPSLQDVRPFVSESITSEDAAFYQQIADGVTVLFDFQSVLSAGETILSDASEPSEPSALSDPSEPSAPSEPSELSEPSAPSEPSEPSAPSEPSEPSAPSEPSEPSTDSF
jgi:hypothetical protein